MMKKIILTIVFTLAYSAITAYAQSDVKFTGTLVEEPCVLDPKDSAINLDFGTVISKMLYSHTRTNGLPLTLHLLECDVSLGSMVQLTFNGVEDLEQPGLLAPDASSSASGVAIGIESLEHQLLPINTPTEQLKIVDGENEVSLLTFVSASSKAIEGHLISPGSLNALMSFSLDYQ